MDERSEVDKLDEIMLPGFRFHPTDEELVGFYLKRKVQHRPLSIELIKQLDIYKYDPWDLPKLATIGEKEWYFYCPRDRKYRNSTRPNRVTGAGFWKATGTDRPIYASEGSKCIGLKKSLVFYKGRAAKGIKTDWMMHEFRLPSLTDSSSHKGGFIDKNIPANDSWAICRIFKKTNSSAQRTISQSWVSPLPETPTCESLLSQLAPQTFTNFNTSEKSTTPTIQFNFNNIDHLHQHSSLASFFPSSYLTSSYNNKLIKPTLNGDQIPSSFPFSSFEASSSGPSRCTTTAESTSMYLNMFGGGDHEFASGLQSEEVQCDNGLSFTLPPLEMKTSSGEETNLMKDSNGAQFEDPWGSIRSVGTPFNNLPLNLPEAWKANLLWDSSPCPSELSTSYSTNKCHS